MCGILGQFRGEGQVDTDAFEQMLATLRNRGPDGEGSEVLDGGRVALGHTRLAIIDLSDAARQPLPNEDQTVWAVVNGEIYNYRELREELIAAGHRFRSTCDSEVVVHAYEDWGDACVDRFRGIFAFGVWDGARRRLFLARDRLGVKPLYYWAANSQFAFASQPRALLADPRFRRDIDFPALQHYLAYRYVPGSMAIYAGMHKLPAAHRLSFEEGRTRVERYWAPSCATKIRDPDTAVERVRDAIAEAVELELVSDVPVGVFLSGGIDSSTVAALMARVQKPPPSFTLGFDEASSDEREYARLAANAIGCQPHEDVMTLEDALAAIPTFIGVYDEPFFDQSGLPTHRVSALARSRNVKVILAGDGGDELFAGYRWYDEFLSRRGRRFARLRAKLLGESSAGAYFDLMGYLDGPAQKKLLVAGSGFDHLALFRGLFREDLPPITALQWLDLHTFLVDDILTKVDHASMANGVEVRVPLLDYRVVETAFSISSDVIYARGERKALLKRAAAPWIPAEILTARKKGFSVPLRAWMKRGLQARASELVRDGSLVGRGVFRADGAEAILARQSPRLTWLLLVAELWARHWIEAEPLTELRTAS